MTAIIDAQTTVGVVSLSVADLKRSREFYQQLGLSELEATADELILGVGSTALLKLYNQPGARQYQHRTGLYHFALRVPTRRDLAQVLVHLAEHQIPVQGLSDHRVSEAIYLSDPDGHGIEIYADRPRDVWYERDGSIDLTTTALNVQNLITELNGEPPLWNGLPDGTDMGHIHLHVADLDVAARFYIDGLGFERVAQRYGALFVSTAGYHHHIGLNTWAGVGVPHAPMDAARLLNFELLLPEQAEINTIVERLTRLGYAVEQTGQTWTVQDPFANTILLKLT